MLKPGGQATIMRYHHPSLSGAVLWLWLRFGIFSGKSLRRVVYDHFESPGTQDLHRRRSPFNDDGDGI
jgi:hypothetical protein